MGTKRSVAAGALAALVLVVAIIFAVPSVDDFSLENPYWNGMSMAASELGIAKAGGSTTPDPEETLLLIVGPDLPFTPSRIAEIRSYLESGGVVVLMDDFGEGNSLLDGLGVGARINGSLLLDPLFMYRSQYYPRAFSAGDSGVGEVTLDYASVVEVEEWAGAKVLLESSAFSYLDLDSDGIHGASEPVGPFPVAAEISYGRGRLVIVSDSSLLINSVYSLGEFNSAFIREIAGARSLYADYGNNAQSTYASLRSGLISSVDALGEYPELRYLLAVAGVWVLFEVDPRPRSRSSSRSRASASRIRGRGGDLEGEDEDGEYWRVAEEHPDWDRGLLRETWEDLKGASLNRPGVLGQSAAAASAAGTGSNSGGGRWTVTAKGSGDNDNDNDNDNDKNENENKDKDMDVDDRKEGRKNKG
ncbi:MAG: DUF4350 domain-containing protein [Candidatus Methanosuratus sp.]|nr:DUF4350 domain-containing protein [Candidatus Methanosuratincola sp.]